MAIAQLADRTIIQVTGEESRGFLDRLITCDLDRVSPGMARYGALLSPQGKILADFIAIQADQDGHVFLLDAPTASASELVRRLTMYKLRAKVAVTTLVDARVVAGWDGAAASAGRSSLPDPRLAALGWRAILIGGEAVPEPSDVSAYAAHRIALGVPESGADFAFGDAFPHEALMDQVSGVDFDKGCYVGQEIVSRMQHRGTARTRVVSVTWDGGAVVAPGAEVLAGERSLGRVGSVAASRGLAMIRLDRAADALAAGTAITADGVALRFDKPAWVRFPYPDEMMAPAA